MVVCDSSVSYTHLDVYKRQALRGGILLQELVWHEKEVKAALLSKINQTVKIQLQGIDKQEIALKAGESVTVVF